MLQVGGGGCWSCFPLRLGLDPADNDSSTGHRLPGVVVTLRKWASGLDFSCESFQPVDLSVRPHPVVNSCEHSVNKHRTPTPVPPFQETDQYSSLVQNTNSNIDSQAWRRGCRGCKTNQGGSHFSWEALLLQLQLNLHVEYLRLWENIYAQFNILKYLCTF